MECSPLRFLDYDMSVILWRFVGLSRKKEAIRFHDALFHYGEKINKKNHALISSIYSKQLNGYAWKLQQAWPRHALSFNNGNRLVDCKDGITIYNNKIIVKTIVKTFEELRMAHDPDCVCWWCVGTDDY